MRDELRLEHLNPSLMRMYPERANAMLDAANMINEAYSSSTTHPFMLGDCILYKMNWLKKGLKPRQNSKHIRHVDGKKGFEITEEELDAATLK